jgi:formamidopyrimidine-DNA glycosylase
VQPATTPPISELGPDAFVELPGEDVFTSTVLKKKCTIKALLLDQVFLCLFLLIQSPKT